jgi:hypothetical protein
MDDGSGIGVLLELARVFATVPTNHGILFVASDGEEWGMLGAADFAQQYSARDRVKAALSLDYVAPGELEELQLATVGQYRGYAAPWLRDVARRAIRAGNIPAAEPFGVEEHLERALLLSWTDQGPLLASGIEAINLGSGSGDRAREWAVYHSADDTAGNLRVESFAVYGQAAERILRTLDDMAAPPDESGTSFRIRPDVFLPGAFWPEDSAGTSRCVTCCARRSRLRPLCSRSCSSTGSSSRAGGFASCRATPSIPPHRRILFWSTRSGE